MSKIKNYALVFFLFIFTGCGPDTIFLRPSLDTPDRHVANGQVLLEQGKYQHALREFKRASELSPKNLDALIGLGVALGYCENYDQGLAELKKAEGVAESAEDRAKLQKGYSDLNQTISSTSRPETKGRLK